MGSRGRWRLVAALLLLAASGLVVAASITYEPIQPTVYVGVQDGPKVGVAEGSKLELTNFTDGPNTVNITSPKGNMTVTAGSNVTFVVDDIEGTYTNLSAIETYGNEAKIDPADKLAANISGDLDTFDWRKDIALDDGTPDFAYSGTGKTATVEVRGVAANTQVAAVNGTGTFLDAGTSDANGVVRFTDLELSSHQVSLKSVDDDDPSLSNPKPQGKQNDFPTKASIKVSDQDFPDDEVNVTFRRRLKGGSYSVVGSDTVKTDDTRAKITMPKPGRGTYEMKATAEDAYGNVVNTTWTFSTPHELFLRNETNATQLIDCSQVSIQFTFYQDGDVDDVTVAQKTCSNSKVDMTGLPVDPYTVTFRPNNTWYDRELYIEDITANQTGFLLNKTAYPNAKTIEFELDDRTGNFPPESSTIRVQRALNTTNSSAETLTWTTVAGDQFDATGSYFFTGETGARYRIVVENSQGDRRVLGPYTIVESRVETLVIGEVGWPQLNGSTTYYRASINHTSSVSGKTPPVISIAYADPQNKTDNLDVKVYERNNESNVIFSASPSGSFGRYYAEVNITEDQANNKTWVVELDYQYAGNPKTQTRIVGQKDLGLPIDQTLLSGAFLVFVPMGIALFGPRTWQYGLTMIGIIIGIGMLLGFVQIAVPAYVIFLVITGAGILRTEATNVPT